MNRHFHLGRATRLEHHLLVSVVMMMSDWASERASGYRRDRHAAPPTVYRAVRGPPLRAAGPIQLAFSIGANNNAVLVWPEPMTPEVACRPAGRSFTELRSARRIINTETR